MSNFRGLGKIQIKGSFFIVLAFALVIVPVEWLVSWIFAAVIHELGHITAISVSGYRIHSLYVSVSGARLITDHLCGEEWYCALAGPAFGLLCALTIRVFPRFGICAIMQTFVNLLPIYPMDGGRVVRSVLSKILTEDKANIITQIITCIVTLVLAVTVSQVKNTGTANLLIAILILAQLKTLQRKFSCKPRAKWVQ